MESMPHTAHRLRVIDGIYFHFALPGHVRDESECRVSSSALFGSRLIPFGVRPCPLVVFGPEKQFVYTLLSENWAVWLFFANFLFLVWRLFNRMTFTGMIYNVRHALMAAPRLVVGNFVNFFATWRAVRIYLSHRISVWPSFEARRRNSYPVHMGDVTLP